MSESANPDPVATPEPVATTPTVAPEGLLDKATRYYQYGLLMLAVVGYGLFATASPAAAQVNIDPEAITQGFFDGFNMILALSGLLALMALPYGIQFAFNFISGIFSRFSSVRF